MSAIYPSHVLPYAARRIAEALAGYSEDPVLITGEKLATDAQLATSSDAIKGLARLADAGKVAYRNDFGALTIWRLDR